MAEHPSIDPRTRRRSQNLFQALVMSAALWGLVFVLFGSPWSSEKMVGLIVGASVNLLVLFMIFKKIRHRNFESTAEPVIDPLTISMFDDQN